MSKTWLDVWNPDDEMIVQIENLTSAYNSKDFGDYWGGKEQDDDTIMEEGDYYYERPDSDGGFNADMYTYQDVTNSVSANKRKYEQVEESREEYDKYIENKKKIDKFRVKTDPRTEMQYRPPISEGQKQKEHSF